MTPKQVQEETIKQVTRILKSPGCRSVTTPSTVTLLITKILLCRKTPVFVKSMETAVEISQTFAKERQCPIFQVSNVTGEGLNYVRIAFCFERYHSDMYFSRFAPS